MTAAAATIITALATTGVALHQDAESRREADKNRKMQLETREQTRVATERSRSEIQTNEARQTRSRQRPRGRRLLLDERATLG